MHQFPVGTEERLRSFVYIDGVSRRPTVLVLPMAFPFEFWFGDHHTLGSKRPRIFHACNINTLCLGGNTPCLPTRPHHIEVTVCLKHRAVDSPVIVRVCRNTPFHLEFALERVFVGILKYIELVIVGISVIGCIVNIPLTVNTVDLRSPQVEHIGRVSGYPDGFTRSVLNIGNIRRYPQLEAVAHSVHIVVIPLVEQRPRVGPALREEGILIHLRLFGTAGKQQNSE